MNYTSKLSKGDWLLVRREDQKWSAYQVNDLIIVSYLVQVGAGDQAFYIEEKNLLDSVKPKGFGSVHCLVDCYETGFNDIADVKSAVSEGRLGKPVCKNLFRSEKEFEALAKDAFVRLPAKEVTRER